MATKEDGKETAIAHSDELLRIPVRTGNNL